MIAQTRELAGQPDARPTEVAEILCGWLSSDVKAEPLKTAHGLICAEGCRSRVLHGEFFDDVPAALVTWRDMGVALHIFSSGSVRNQQDWFAYARGGELASFLSDHPDELDAAAAAGWLVLGVSRPGEPNSPRPPHRWISSFDEIDLSRQWSLGAAGPVSDSG